MTKTATAEQTVKAMCIVKSVADSTDPNGEFDLILSAPTLDRDGEVLDSKALEPLPDHITMDVDHGMSVATTAGSGVPSYDADGTLRVRGSYASTDLGQTVRTLVNEGHIRTASVAFISKSSVPATKSADGKKHITAGELLNGAFTPVPSNTDAVILTSKGVRAAEQALKEGRRNSTADGESLQTAHDAVVAAGASCSAGSAKRFRAAAGIKSIVGSVEALQDRVSDALEDAYGGSYGYWGWLRGVVPNPAGDGGTVVFQSSQVDPAGYESATYSQTYTDDGQVVTLTVEASEVDIHEVVVPDADADREEKSSKTDPDLTQKAAGSGDEDADDTELRLRAAALRANSALL